ncbi:hypothetical protein KIS4809_5275 [Bacillus sp. ZZV12-4809]|nr:hypothetical protein KIS4809_5275 [Bacillus sp. ZZV12-4809]
MKAWIEKHCCQGRKKIMRVSESKENIFTPYKINSLQEPFTHAL